MAESEAGAFVRVQIVFRVGANQLDNPKAIYRMSVTERDRLVTELVRNPDGGIGVYDAEFTEIGQRSQPRKLLLRFVDVLYIG